MMRFFHPQMIAQCANKPGPTIDQMIDFVIAGLSPREQGELTVHYLTWPSLPSDAKLSVSCERSVSLDSSAVARRASRIWSLRTAPRNDEKEEPA